MQKKQNGIALTNIVFCLVGAGILTTSFLTMKKDLDTQINVDEADIRELMHIIRVNAYRGEKPNARTESLLLKLSESGLTTGEHSGQIRFPYRDRVAVITPYGDGGPLTRDSGRVDSVTFSCRNLGTYYKPARLGCS